MIKNIRFAKFAWIFSLVIFFVLLFLGYFYWPQIVDVKLDKDIYHVSDIYINKEYLFYYFLGAVLIVNFLISIMSNTLLNLPKAAIRVPELSFWTESVASVNATRVILHNWALSLGAALNMILSFFIAALLVINYQDQFTGSRNFNWLLPSSFILIVLVFLYPIYRFRKKSFSTDNSKY